MTIHVREPGEKLGRFRIERSLGAGEMGRVYGALDELLGRRVAVKLLLDGGDGDAVMDEARALAALRHPNVVFIYELARTDDGPLVVMEWIDGRSADTLLADGPVPPSSASSIVSATASAIAAVHAAGWVHGDVKPSNILIERGTARVVLADMGLAQRVESTAPGKLVRATAAYLSPEAALGAPVPVALQPRRDVYALAATAYELLTGAPPFDDVDPRRVLRSHVYDPIPRADDRVPSLGWRVHRALARGLAKDPAARTAHPVAFAAELARAIARRRTPMRLLVVDGDRDERQSYSAALARRFRGAQIEAVSDGDTGLHAAIATSPDLAIVNVARPCMRGVELVAMLRATPGLEHLPVIVLGAGAMARRDREVLRDLGVGCVLDEPVAGRELGDHARDALGLTLDTGAYVARPPHARTAPVRKSVAVTQAPPTPKPRTAAKTVLIVEDDDELREGMAILLERRGPRVVSARDGHEALAAIDPEAPPALILLDLMMPAMDGWQVRQQLRKDARLASIPVVLISALPDLELACRRLEASDFFPKPVDFPRLYGVVDHYCAA